jgi:hypothetical protein
MSLLRSALIAKMGCIITAAAAVGVVGVTAGAPSSSPSPEFGGKKGAERRCYQDTLEL